MPTSPILRARRVLAVLLAGGGAATAGIAFALTSSGAGLTPGDSPQPTSDRAAVRSDAGANDDVTTRADQQGSDAFGSEQTSPDQQFGGEEQLDSVVPDDSAGSSSPDEGADGFSQAQPPQQAPGGQGGHSASRGS